MLQILRSAFLAFTSIILVKHTVYNVNIHDTISLDIYMFEFNKNL